MFEHFYTFLIAISLLTITPGVDTLLVIRNTRRGGWWDGALSSLGISCGLFVHATVSAVGISVILMQTAWAFQALKLAGAIYLVFLGLSSLVNAARHRSQGQAVSRAQPGRFRARRSLREGLLSNVLNPKTVIFYMAFLPQFINAAGSALEQSLLLAAIHFLIAMLWQCLVAWLVIRAAKWVARPRLGALVEAVTGSLLVSIGVRLALTDRH